MLLHFHPVSNKVLFSNFYMVDLIGMLLNKVPWIVFPCLRNPIGIIPFTYIAVFVARDYLEFANRILTQNIEPGSSKSGSAT